MFSLLYTFFIFYLIFAVCAVLDIDQLQQSIAVIDADVDCLQTAINRFDGIVSGIAIVKAVVKLKEDTDAATTEAKKGRPDHFPTGDSLNITSQTEAWAEKFVGALDGLVDKVDILYRFRSLRMDR